MHLTFLKATNCAILIGSLGLLYVLHLSIHYHNQKGTFIRYHSFYANNYVSGTLMSVEKVSHHTKMPLQPPSLFNLSIFKFPLFFK